MLALACKGPGLNEAYAAISMLPARAFTLKNRADTVAMFNLTMHHPQLPDCLHETVL